MVMRKPHGPKITIIRTSAKFRNQLIGNRPKKFQKYRKNWSRKQTAHKQIRIITEHRAKHNYSYVQKNGKPQYKNSKKNL